jgi:shikimate kinase
MGAGKSTVGRQLARDLDMAFVDSDHEIEERTGVGIPLIFDLEGEAGFRQREHAMLAELTQRTNVVLATGGGAVLNRENRSFLVQRGFVIYLCAPIEQLVERTRRDRNRPLLQTPDPRARLEELIAERDPLYRAVADLIVKTDHRTVRSVVKEVKRRLSSP